VAWPSTDRKEKNMEIAIALGVLIASVVGAAALRLRKTMSGPGIIERAREYSLPSGSGAIGEAKLRLSLRDESALAP
jgi:hypothetical protein